MFKKIMIILIFLLLAIGVASAHDDKAYSSIDINDIKLPNEFKHECIQQLKTIFI